MVEETPVTPAPPVRPRMSATRRIPEPVVVDTPDEVTPAEVGQVRVAAISAAHDSDPAGWHRRMLEPPRTRETTCRFCGHLYGPWSPADGRPVEVDGYKQ